MKQPQIKPVEHSLFDTANTLDEAWAYISANLKGSERNRMFSLIMVYHNTLVKQLSV